MNSWKDVPLNIAVSGQSGAGKSTIINTIRGLIPTAAGACEVGVTETTNTVSKHPHPRHKNFVLWDLPGVGTPNFPQGSYLEDVEFDKYDFFLIIAKVRFTENDLWLAKEVERAGKVFFLVRTALDIDLQNEKNDKPSTYSERNVIRIIRQNCEENLQKANISSNVYIIGGKMKHRTLWDFPELLTDIINKTSGLKRHALVLSLTSSSRGIIEEKYRSLMSRMNIEKFFMGGYFYGGMLKILDQLPSAHKHIEVKLFLDAVQHFKQEFGLDDGYLHTVSAVYGIPMHKLTAAIEPVMETTEMTLEVLSQSVEPKHILEVILHCIPIVGNVSSGAVFAYRGKKYQTKLLQDMKKAALIVQDLIDQVSKREI